MDELVIARAAVVTAAALIAEQFHPRAGAVVAILAATASASFEESVAGSLAAAAIVGTLFHIIRTIRGDAEGEK